METKDCNGKPINNGDTIILTKDLKVQGGDTLKKGTVCKNIKLTDDTGLIEYGSGRNTICIKTEFVKKKW